MYSTTLKISIQIAALLFMGLMLPNQAEAHCDSMDGPVVLAAQEALETGSLKELRDLIVREFESALHSYFDDMMEAKNFNTNDVQAGREFVHKYVEFMHYANPVYNIVKMDGVADHAH